MTTPEERFRARQAEQLRLFERDSVAGAAALAALTLGLTLLLALALLGLNELATAMMP
nr:hypothetical protein [uncultured Rhodopila sp.]